MLQQPSNKLELLEIKTGWIYIVLICQKMKRTAGYLISGGLRWYHLFRHCLRRRRDQEWFCGRKFQPVALTLPEVLMEYWDESCAVPPVQALPFSERGYILVVIFNTAFKMWDINYSVATAVQLFYNVEYERQKLPKCMSCWAFLQSPISDPGSFMKELVLLTTPVSPVPFPTSLKSGALSFHHFCAVCWI